MKFVRIYSSALMLGLLFSHGLLATEYNVAVRAHNGIENAINQWQPTLDVLAKQLPQHTFNLKPIVSLNEISAAVVRSEIDFVLTNPSSFVELERKRLGNNTFQS